jgi:hypothetical protein
MKVQEILYFEMAVDWTIYIWDETGQLITINHLKFCL